MEIKIEIGLFVGLMLLAPVVASAQNLIPPEVGAALAQQPPTPDRATIAAVDATLDKMSSTLPRQMDEYSDLVKVHRKSSR